MHHRPTVLNHGLMLARTIAVTLAMLLATAMASGLTAHAQEPRSEDTPEQGQARFNIKPVESDGSYFDLEMSPGETRQLAVEIGNSGDGAGTVTTYAANVHTLVNGGMGLGEASEAPGPITAWLDYAPRSFELEPGIAEVHTFVVNVPEDTLPGQYITSIVVQAADAQQITGSSDGVSLGAVTRKGMAVAITVPGDAAPSMSIGAARHILSTDHSVVSFAIENTGYTRLKPTGEFVLADSDGVELTRFPVTMGIFYAQTATTVEIPFSTILNPGTYRVALSLVDETHDITASADSLTLIVEKPAAPVAPDGTPQVATIDQQPGAPTDAAAAPDSNGTSAAVLVAVGAVSGCLVFGIIAGGMLWVRRRPTANTPRSGTSAVADPPASASVSIPAVQRPVTVTQLISRPTMEQDQ